MSVKAEETLPILSHKHYSAGRRFLKPAHLAFTLGGVDLLPMMLAAQIAHNLSLRCTKPLPAEPEQAPGMAGLRI